MTQMLVLNGKHVK